MKHYRIGAVLALALAVVTVGAGASPAADAVCAPTKAVFYTTDTMNLARALAANKSDCADYYISITPTGGGLPRGGAALATVQGQGAQFHALAELQPKQWASYAATYGWYETGVMLHDAMLAVGYKPERGDTWIVNEVGIPSDSSVNTDVFYGIGNARQGFRDFVRGLFTGSGGPALPGLVFAANAPQLSPNAGEYASQLASWYADTAFWEDMQRYVDMWAQETYADARAWGVTGSPLEERTAYLNDYFLHGLRVAADGDDATAAARSFLARAYVPLANAAYRWGGPNPVTGIGFGFTDIGVPGMLRFVSAQTYALRSSLRTRIGFAVVPRSDTPADRAAVQARVAAAIRDSQIDAIGACTASGEACDFDVDGAVFPSIWRSLANTQEGFDVPVQVGPGVALRFDQVSARGTTWLSSKPTTDAPSGWAADGLTYEIASTASTSGSIEVCLGAASGHIFERSAAGWIDRTSSPGCGATETLGAFARFVDPTPPLLVPHVEGELGDAGWYTGDVTVSWEVSDPQTQVTTSGCDTAVVSADTAGTTFTCVATSEGGTSRQSVTVRRDATPPTLTCTPTPAELWPPNGKLMPVSVAVVVTDGVSGASGFRLTAAPAEDASDFVVGTADVDGRLRAERDGNGGDRTYRTYTGRDVAGNTAECVATIVVPHDRRD